MYSFFIILIFIIGILLVLIVLIQNSKGGGLVSNFSAQNQILGVKKTADFLEKATWVLASFLLLSCLLAAATVPKKAPINNIGELEKTLQENSVQLQAKPFTQPVEIKETKPENENEKTKKEK